MKFKLSQKAIFTLAIVVIFIIFLFKIGFISYYPGEPMSDLHVYTFEPNKLDSIQDKIWRAKNVGDSLQFEKRIIQNGGQMFAGWTIGSIGIGELISYEKNKRTHYSKDYVVLPSVRLNIHEHAGNNYLNYYTRDGQGYLSRMSGKKEGGYTHYVYNDTKVDYVYVEDKIYLPIKNIFLQGVIFAFQIIFGAFLIALSLFAVLKFFKFLLAVANNNAFEAANVNRLKHIYIALLLGAIVPFLASLTVYLFFITNYTSDGITFRYDNDYYWSIILTVIFYVMYIAFKKGHMLQDENDLTI